MDEIAAFSELIGVDRDETAPASSRERAAARLDEQIAAIEPAPERERRLFRLPRSPRNRLALAGLVAAVLIAGGWIGARQFDQTLFGDGSAHPTPAELASLFDSMKGEFALEPTSVAAIADFTSTQGKLTLYEARMARDHYGGSGIFFTYLNDQGKFASLVGGGIAGTYWWPSDAGKAGESLLVHSQGLKGVVNGADGIAQVIGIAPDSTHRLEIRFQDGTSEMVPLHNGLFGYFVGGERCKTGHEPSEIVALDVRGQTIDSEDLLIKAGCVD